MILLINTYDNKMYQNTDVPGGKNVQNGFNKDHDKGHNVVYPGFISEGFIRIVSMQI